MTPAISEEIETSLFHNESQYILIEKYYNGQLGSPGPAKLEAIFLGISAIVAVILNVALVVYIIAHKLYQNFISSHFIAHLCLTNLICIVLLMPIFLFSTYYGQNLFELGSFYCRLQSLFCCTVWTVVQLMVLCISGVHLLTFARIHYEQLFGASPNVLCGLSWAIAISLSLPCITNSNIVRYDPNLRQCIWGQSDSAYKFLTYMLILGLVIPASLASYAYIRVLGILYHSPIVFQSIGLYKSRFLVYAFLANPLYQGPIFAISFIGTNKFIESPWIPLMASFLCYFQCIISPVLYGASLVLMKEEDMALTARAHKGLQGLPNSYQPGQQLTIPGQHL